MEVKRGYKQTEVGIIPEEWDVKPLAKVFALKHGFAFSSDYFSKSGPIVLTPGNFRLDGGLYFEERNTKRYSGKYGPDMTFRKGDLLIVMTDLTPDCNLLGKPAFFENNETVLHNQRIGEVQLKDKSTDVRLLYFMLLSRRYLDRLKEQATGSTVRHTSNKSIYSVQLAWPQQSEQRAIARALTDVDSLLDGLDRLIAKKHDLKQAVMQQLLTGQTRLPGFHGKGELIWMRDVLKQNATYGIVTAGAFVREGVKMLRGGDIVDGCINTDLPMVSHEKAAEYTRTKLMKNDVVIALVGYPGASARIADDLIGANISRAVGLLRPNEKVSPDFLVCFLNSSEGRRMVLAPSAGSAQQVVNLAALNKLQFSVPTIAEQTAIAEVLTDMDAELAALEQRREKTRALKQAMMQELLTGRIRLVQPETAEVNA